MWDAPEKASKDLKENWHMLSQPLKAAFILKAWVEEQKAEREEQEKAMIEQQNIDRKIRLMEKIKKIRKKK